MEQNSQKQLLLGFLKKLIDRARAVEKYPQIFCTIEYEFAEKLDHDSQLESIKKSIAEIENNDNALIVDLRKKATAEMNYAETTIRNDLERRKIKADGVIQCLDICKLGQGNYAGQFFELRQALFILQDDATANHDALIEQFATVKTSNEIVEPVYESIIGESKLDQIELEKRKNDKFKKLRHVNNEICSHILVIKENIIESKKKSYGFCLPIAPSVDEDLRSFRDSEKQCIESNDEREADFYLKACHMLGYGALVKLARYDEIIGNKHLSFFKKLGVIKEKRWIDKLNFAPSLDQLQQEEALLEKCQETKIWYARNKVFDLYQNFANYDIKTLNTLEYLNYMEKIVSYIEENLPEDEILPALTAQDKVENTEWSYDHSTTTFKYNEVTIKLRKDKFITDILDLLTKNHRNRGKEWTCKKINTVLDHANIVKNKVYDSVRNFARRLALNAKIDEQDFIIHNTLTIKINPKIAKNQKQISNFVLPKD